MRIALVVLALLLFSPEVLAGGAAWNHKTIVVEDRTSAAWDGVVAQTVVNLNAALPSRAPRLVYQRGARTDCGKRKHAIVVCSVAEISGLAGLTLPYQDYHSSVIEWAQIRLNDGWHINRARAERENTACHEFIHAVTGIPDNPGVAPDTSCVWGNLTSPGPFDVDYAKKVYGDRKHKHR